MIGAKRKETCGNGVGKSDMFCSMGPFLCYLAIQLHQITYV